MGWLSLLRRGRGSRRPEAVAAETPIDAHVSSARGSGPSIAQTPPADARPEIFISYRREDAWATSAKVYEELKDEFGKENIFLDVSALTHQQEWSQKIDEALDGCKIVVALVGPHWAKPSGSDRSRLLDEKDVVRRELTRAVERRVPIIILLLDGARTPDEADLPPELKQLFKTAWAEILRANNMGHLEQDLEGVKRLLLEKQYLPVEGSKAREHAHFKERQALRGTIVVQFDITGFEAALSEDAKQWKGMRPDERATFSCIAPRFLQRVRWHVEAEIQNEFGEAPAQYLPEGCVLFIDRSRSGASLAAVAETCKRLVAEFRSIVALYAPSDALGFHWPLDLRIAIADGNLEVAELRRNGVREMVRTGPPLARLERILAGNAKGEDVALLRRGEVALVGCAKVANWKTRDIAGGVKSELSGGSDEPAPSGALIPLQVWSRAPDTRMHFRIPSKIAEELKNKTLTSDDRAQDLVRHVPPRMYPDIAAKAKTGARICILVGAPGSGKTLCALRLVAEMMYIDGLEPSIPPVAPETWEALRANLGSERVIFLDDALGKTDLVDDSTFELIVETLCGPADEDSFLSRDVSKRPALIITARDDIWRKACLVDPSGRLKNCLERHVEHIADDAYSDEERGEIFDRFWERSPSARAGSPRPDSYESIKQEAIQRIRHPYSLRDYVLDWASGAQRLVRPEIAPYTEKPLDRLKNALAAAAKQRTRDPLGLLYFFLFAYGSGFREEEGLRRAYLQAAAQLGQRDAALGYWNMLQAHEFNALNRWGRLQDNGVFAADHPLRSEALEEFFCGPQQGDVVEAYVATLRGLPDGADASPELAVMVSYAAARIPGRLGSERRRVIDEACIRSDDGQLKNEESAQALAASAGWMFRRAAAGRYEATPLGETGAALRKAIGSLFQQVTEKPFGVAFGALCDAYGSNTNGADWEAIAQVGLSALENARCHPIVTVGADVERDQVRVQNVEHAIWAIASNFPRLPDSFRRMLKTIAEDRTIEWFRLRALEAICDYVAGIREQDDYRDWVDSLVADAASVKETIAYRRGALGAWEANFEEVEALSLLSPYLDPSSTQMQRDSGLGVLEWSIWAIGEHLSKDTCTSELVATLRKLSSHEDVRVRKWLATALAESGETKKDPKLRELLMSLARDDDEVVRGQAVNFFLRAEE
jgi:hypothetical protein